MNTSQLIVTGLFILVISCTSKKDDDVLSPSKMEAILKDIHVAESTINVRNIPIDSAKMYFYAMEKDIFRKHHTDSANFHKSFKYHLSSGKDFEKIYTNLVDSLGLLESKE